MRIRLLRLRKSRMISIFLPVLLGISLFLLIRPRVEQTFARDLDVGQYVGQGDVLVESEVVDGHQQVYYEFNGRKSFVSELDNLNSYQADSRGPYIVWVTSINGAGQIFRHHIPSGETIQITDSSSNGQPRVDRLGNVVWERWVWLEEEGADGTWQVFLFDGVSTRQITSGTTSINPDVDGDRIVFAQRTSDGEWAAIEYRRDTRQVREIQRGFVAKQPYFDGGEIKYGRVSIREPRPVTPVPTRPVPTAGPALTEDADATFSADEEPEPTQEPAPTDEPEPIPELVSTTAPTSTPTEPETVSEEDIIEELLGEPEIKATGSGEVEE